ncbi:MAG: imidazoleglycerol-phosphate dehydratase HisB [Candidatus Omnitrophica bacterium]|nr:imidazoleglycerol-phosphate dehydratase HisB [Candidatus Omnitrophota bacterium]
MSRSGDVSRKTKETNIVVKVNVDGKGRNDVKTQIGFLDHMLDLFAYHGLFDLTIKAEGDLNVDIHHTNEDIGICLGQAFKRALGDCKGVKRFGSAEVPMDQARAKVAIDISNRYAFSGLKSKKPIQAKENYSIDDANDLLDSFAKNMNLNLHVDLISGNDLHHVLEATFKAFGIALDQATQIDPRRKEVPSTKGIL